jgi:DnaK suppressor protein
MSLTDTQRQHLERRLLEERERVVEALRRYERESGVEQREQDGDLTVVPLHPADEGTDMMQRELEASIAAQETVTLEQIDQALERLYHQPERFGVDEHTGEAIPFERLEIIPWARTAAHRRPGEPPADVAR